jgi:hypothetical protein
MRDKLARLLRTMETIFPPGNTDSHHSLTLHDDKLSLNLVRAVGSTPERHWWRFTLDDADLDKTPERLADEIVAVGEEGWPPEWGGKRWPREWVKR